MSASGRTPARACPERTCLGCRERAAKSELLRIVLNEGVCVPDHRGTLPGRGAYVHPAPTCLDLALRRRAFLRAFKVPGPLDTTTVVEAVGTDHPVDGDGRAREQEPRQRRGKR